MLRQLIGQHPDLALSLAVVSMPWNQAIRYRRGSCIEPTAEQLESPNHAGREEQQ